MRKRLAVLAIVLVMLAAGSVPALAQGSYPPGTVWNSPFTVQNMGANSAMVYVEYYRLSDGFFIDTATQSFSVLPSRSVIVDPKLNPDPALTAGLYSVVTGRGITMCGIAPATVAIAACKELGASKGELIKYDTSATASGDSTSVVGYAGLIFS